MIKNNGEDSIFTLREKIILILFILPFPIMIWGRHDSGMVVPDYGVYVLAFTIVIMLIVALGKNGLGEKSGRCIC